MTIHFYIRFYTRPGESLAVTGNTVELGNNTIEHAVPLTWQTNEFWTGTVHINGPITEPIRYKYIYKGTDGVSIPEWEDGKCIDIHPGVEEMNLVDIWNRRLAWLDRFLRPQPTQQ